MAYKKTCFHCHVNQTTLCVKCIPPLRREKLVDELTAQALKAFTTRYCDAWQEKHGSAVERRTVWRTFRALFLQPAMPFTGSRNLLKLGEEM